MIRYSLKRCRLHPHNIRNLSSYPSNWESLASKEISKDPKSLEWKTPEGIVIKPLYTANDLPDDTRDGSVEAPGIYPFKRGPYATMYTAKPYVSI
jgi:methylmalonyl-CoA mutase